jgi:hypothetical protein
MSAASQGNPMVPPEPVLDDELVAPPAPVVLL